MTHNESISQNVSIIDPNYPIPDPLPFIKCKKYGEITNTSTKILYGSSLANLLKAENLTNADVYENASSPLFIKKCPYDLILTMEIIHILSCLKIALITVTFMKAMMDPVFYVD